MAYMLLIVEPRDQRAERSKEEGRRVYAQMLEFADGLRSRGTLLACESLSLDAEGVRVQKLATARGGWIDGPFAEAKEMIGGFFLLNCETREEALAIAGIAPRPSGAPSKSTRPQQCCE